MKTRNNIKSITFFYPSKVIGGAEFLFLRIAEYLVHNTNLSIYIIDFKDGFLRKRASLAKISFIEYNLNRNVIIDYDTFIITPLNHIFDVYNFQVKSSYSVRVLFWSIHPKHFTNFYSTLRRIGIGEKKMQKTSAGFKALIERGSLVFMDYPNFKENSDFLGIGRLDPMPYLPICCPSYGDISEPTERFEKQNHIINFCWLGRIANDKVGAIINLITHMEQLPEGRRNNIVFHIIGSGEAETALANRLTRTNVKIHRLNKLVGEELNKYLIENIDVGYAMGTSSLEFAKLKIPVILADMIIGNPVTDNKFNWLYETQEYSLGSYYDEATERRHSLEYILNELSSKLSYGRESNLCYEYFSAHHTMQAVSSKLLSYLDKPGLAAYDDESLRTIFYCFNPLYFRILKRIKSLLIR
ncbi:hypothetical protein [Arcticibacter sp.]|uniref:hypothetical protein n=1 Tax=Arcticibacter sp. TaxID=1872630 RepID=UPI00388E61E0